jgi:hypothetical protein
MLLGPIFQCTGPRLLQHVRRVHRGTLSDGGSRNGSGTSYNLGRLAGAAARTIGALAMLPGIGIGLAMATTSAFFLAAALIILRCPTAVVRRSRPKKGDVVHREPRSRIVWLCALAVGVSVSCGQAQQDTPPASAGGTPAQQSRVERGQYMATVMDCNGCHTPFKNGEPDMTKRLSGHPESVGVKMPPKLPEGWAVAINDTNTEWAGPWGISFTANLTSDQNTGLGTWTEEMFINAIRRESTWRRRGTSFRPCRGACRRI